MEQEPNCESRVLLSDHQDALGMPRCEIRWKLSESNLRTAQVFSRVIREQFAKAGLGDVHVSDWLADPPQDWPLRVRDQYHHIGTCLMHDSPRMGVVNRDCQLHSVPNLYVSRSAIFSTGGHVNSTLTIIAWPNASPRNCSETTGRRQFVR